MCGVIPAETIGFPYLNSFTSGYIISPICVYNIYIYYISYTYYRCVYNMNYMTTSTLTIFFESFSQLHPAASPGRFAAHLSALANHDTHPLRREQGAHHLLGRNGKERQGTSARRPGRLEMFKINIMNH